MRIDLWCNTKKNKQYRVIKRIVYRATLIAFICFAHLSKVNALTVTFFGSPEYSRGSLSATILDASTTSDSLTITPPIIHIPPIATHAKILK
ncbi:hypothetical protein R9C00_04940 [Flammeovirgaceae bacterium SG7u.111]|nr:hypothetical protein [Flammeovirgaceae bacterium SG7u.132]WPO36790.1 hypothetical protein R9C00_04940 [Flammeovirgaceae bacterium SG7u.111]